MSHSVGEGAVFFHKGANCLGGLTNSSGSILENCNSEILHFLIGVFVIVIFLNVCIKNSEGKPDVVHVTYRAEMFTVSENGKCRLGSKYGVGEGLFNTAIYCENFKETVSTVEVGSVVKSPKTCSWVLTFIEPVNENINEGVIGTFLDELLGSALDFKSLRSNKVAYSVGTVINVK